MDFSVRSVNKFLTCQDHTVGLRLLAQWLSKARDVRLSGVTQVDSQPWGAAGSGMGVPVRDTEAGMQSRTPRRTCCLRGVLRPSPAPHGTV